MGKRAFNLTDARILIVNLTNVLNASKDAFPLEGLRKGSAGAATVRGKRRRDPLDSRGSKDTAVSLGVSDGVATLMTRRYTSGPKSEVIEGNLITLDTQTGRVTAFSATRMEREGWSEPVVVHTRDVDTVVGNIDRLTRRLRAEERAFKAGDLVAYDPSEFGRD